MKTDFTLKKTALALALIGYSMGGAYAIMTTPTSTIKGTVPTLLNGTGIEGVDFSLQQQDQSALTTGDQISLEYIYSDIDGDLDASTVQWYAVTPKSTIPLDTALITNTLASGASGTTGRSVLKIPLSAAGATTFKVEITAISATGDPKTGNKLTIEDITTNKQAHPVVIPGPVKIASRSVLAGIYDSTDTNFDTNLIGHATNPQVDKTYVFKLWADENADQVPDDKSPTGDLTALTSYTWVLTGTSASGDATGDKRTTTADGNFLVPDNTAAERITNSKDGAQGFSLAVDYNYK